MSESIAFADAAELNTLVDKFFTILPDCTEPLIYSKMFYAYMKMYFERVIIKLNGGDSEVKEDREDYVCLSDFYCAAKDLCDKITNRFVIPKKSGNDSDIEIVEAYLKEHFREQIVIKDIAKMIYARPGYFGSVFTKKMGISIKEYIHGLRLEEAVRLLSTTDKTISDISYEVGYNSYNNFFLKFTRKFGMPPQEYKRLFCEN